MCVQPRGELTEPAPPQRTDGQEGVQAHSAAQELCSLWQTRYILSLSFLTCETRMTTPISQGCWEAKTWHTGPVASGSWSTDAMSCSRSHLPPPVH